MFKFSKLLILFSMGCGALCGCGGGSGGGNSGVQQLLFSFSVAWPGRSRALNAPTSALSGRVTLTDALGKVASQFTIQRPPGIAPVESTYSAVDPVPVGDYTMKCDFFAGSAQTGANVAVATGPLHLALSGSSANFTFTTTIASVELAPVALQVGESQQLVATAYDANHAIVVVAPGSFTYAVASGGNCLSMTPFGTITGTAFGAATVITYIDGHFSAPLTVSVGGQTGCTDQSYTPNFANAIRTSTDPKIAGHLYHWGIPTLKVAIIQDANWTSSLDADLRAAITQWQESIGGGIPVTYQPTAGGADIIIHFTALPAGEDANVNASIYSGTNELSSVVLLISKDIPSDTIATAVALRAFGHALGILGSSPNSADAMSNVNSGQTILTASDKNTLKTIYCGSFPGPTTIVRGSRPTSTLSTMILYRPSSN